MPQVFVLKATTEASAGIRAAGHMEHRAGPLPSTEQCWSIRTVHERRLEGPNLSMLTPASLKSIIIPRTVCCQLPGCSMAEKLTKMVKVSFPRRAAEHTGIARFNRVEVAWQRQQHKGERGHSVRCPSEAT